jgi:hypothetical protein
MSFKAARAQLSPAEIAQTRADLEAIDMQAWAAEAGEESTIIEGAPPEVAGLLARARRALDESQGVAAADLQTAIDELDKALRLGGQEAVEERSEALLDLLYEMDEDEDDDEQA